MLTNSYAHMLVVGDLALLAMNAIAFLFLCLSLLSSPSSWRSNILHPLSHSPSYLRSGLSHISAFFQLLSDLTFNNGAAPFKITDGC